MQSFWEIIRNYYSKVGMRYNINPIIFLGIHIVATPLFIISVSWLIVWHHKKKKIFYPLITSGFIFNMANIYLIIFGKNIAWYIYFIVAFTTLISGYFSYIKIKKRLNKF